MLKRFATTIDQDQRDVLVSTGAILFIALLAARECSVVQLLLILPLQFAITSLFSKRTPVKRHGRTFTETRSNKSWSAAVPDTFLQAGFVFTFFAGALAFAHQHHCRWLSVFLLVCPLLLSRAVLFIRKLPLAALYPHELLEIGSPESEQLPD